MSDELGLLTIKVTASSITHKLEAIEQIREAWDSDETEFAQSRLEIGLQIEYAIHASGELVTMSEQLLNSPPAYNSNPNERRQRRTELTVLHNQLLGYTKTLKFKVEKLKEQVNESVEMRVEEAYARAKQITLEAKNIAQGVEKLEAGEGTK